ncbi:hypothetical protein RSAG8_04811, partial [Rhizoctonia solani AG-8 WAC10335]
MEYFSLVGGPQNLSIAPATFIPDPFVGAGTPIP